MNINQDTLSVSTTHYGNLEGEALYLVTLKNADVVITVTNLGAAVTSVSTPDREGITKNIVAGFEDLLAYRENKAYFGCTIGRYANRIAGGTFMLDGRQLQLSVNNDDNHLHGGVEGFNKKIWQIIAVINEPERIGVTLGYLSRDGEEGYPGNLEVKVTYTLDSNNKLGIAYSASTDKRTPVSLTNHSYFNLSGFEVPSVLDHILYIDALYYTEKSNRNVATGRILPLKGTPLDFLQPKRVGDDIDKFPLDMGFDHNYVLQQQARGAVALVAELEDPRSGRLLRVFTDQPGIQLYTANFWDGSIFDPQGKPYIKHGAVALETQAFPDSPNQENFPDTILDPGNIYSTSTIYEFGVR